MKYLRMGPKSEHEIQLGTYITYIHSMKLILCDIFNNSVHETLWCGDFQLWCVLAFLYHNQVPEAGHLWKKRVHSFSDWSPDFMVWGPLSIDLSPHGGCDVGSKEWVSEQEGGVARWGQTQACITILSTELTKIQWEIPIPSWGHVPSDLRTSCELHLKAPHHFPAHLPWGPHSQQVNLWWSGKQHADHGMRSCLCSKWFRFWNIVDFRFPHSGKRGERVGGDIAWFIELTYVMAGTGQIQSQQGRSASWKFWWELMF